MIDGVRIRAAVPADVDELARLRVLMDREEGAAEPAGFRQLFARWFERHGNRFRVLVAELGDRLVGTVWLERVERVPRPSEPEPSDGVLIVWPSDRSISLYRHRGFAPPPELLECSVTE